MSRDDATSLQITLVADNQNGRLSRAHDSVERYTHAINIETKNNYKYKDGSNSITFHRHYRKRMLWCLYGTKMTIKRNVIVHPKWREKSHHLLTELDLTHVVSNLYVFLSPAEHKRRYFEECLTKQFCWPLTIEYFMDKNTEMFNKISSFVFLETGEWRRCRSLSFTPPASLRSHGSRPRPLVTVFIWNIEINTGLEQHESEFRPCVHKAFLAS